MKIIILTLLLASCSTQKINSNEIVRQETDEEQLFREVSEINSTVNDLTFAVHRPLYNIPEE